MSLSLANKIMYYKRKIYINLIIICVYLSIILFTAFIYFIFLSHRENEIENIISQIYKMDTKINNLKSKINDINLYYPIWKEKEQLIMNKEYDILFLQEEIEKIYSNYDIKNIKINISKPINVTDKFTKYKRYKINLVKYNIEFNAFTDKDILQFVDYIINSLVDHIVIDEIYIKKNTKYDFTSKQLYADISRGKIYNLFSVDILLDWYLIDN